MGAGGLFLRKMRAKISDQPTGFVWIQSGRLAASGYPASRGQVEWLVKQGINSILTLTEKPIPEESTEGITVTVRHVPMLDHEPPGRGSLDLAAGYVSEELEAGRNVLVHCLAGEGRTGCVMVAYLIKSRGIGAEEAMRILREIKPAFVEPSQERAVADYAAAAKP